MMPEELELSQIDDVDEELDGDEEEEEEEEDDDWDDLEVDPGDLCLTYTFGAVGSGSRTIDNESELSVEYDRGTFNVTREASLWSVSDLFDEMNFWPDDKVWSGTHPSLGGLIKDAAVGSGTDLQEFLKILEQWSENSEPGIIDYLKLEGVEGIVFASGLADVAPEELDPVVPTVEDNFQVPGFPSERFQPGSYYRGFEFSFTEAGWQGTMWEPYAGDELFHPDTWSVDSFDDFYASISGSISWSKEELAQVLIDNDPDWKYVVTPRQEDSEA
jgi:hypothetical protein